MMMNISRVLGVLALSSAIAACGSGEGGSSSSGSTSASGTGGASASSGSSSNGQGGGTSTSTSGSGQQSLLDIDGKLTAGAGKTIPASADVVAVWSVVSGTPDYGYVYGSGQSTSSTFKFSFDKAPPAEALNSNGLGVSFIFLFPQGKALAEGKVTSEALNTALKTAIGGAEKYVIIFKAPNTPAEGWWGAFPEGYSCGKVAPPKPGESFDSFTPVNCSEVSITVDDPANLKFPNWS